MSEMIERVAKALWDKDQQNLIDNRSITNQILFGKKHGEKVSWEEVTGNHVVNYFVLEYRAKAKVAIEAMRKPTEAMIDKGGFTYSTGDGMILDDAAKECWQTMIDEALK